MFGCCDESGIHKKSRWWVIGAMWLPDDEHLPKYEASATAMRQQHNCWGEFKWERLGPKHLGVYEEFVRETLALPGLRFTSIVVDTDLFRKDDMQTYHAAGGRSEAYLKFMRLLLKHRIRGLVDDGHRDFTVLYDKLAVRRDLVTAFRSYLQDDMTNLSVRRDTSCRFVHLAPVNSATLHLMQATDLLTGATWSAWDKTEDTGTNADARQAITDQIVAWAGGSLTNTTFNKTRYYSLWKWRPSN
jgi:hypothetical protein